MTPTELRRIGEALYGERWQKPLAAALGVADRTIRRWLAGGDIPAGVPADLAALLHAHGGDLRRMAAELRRAA